MAHDLLGTGEALAVAELGPHHHRQQPADPVLAVGQRPTAGLTPTEALQVGLQRAGLDGDGVDHPIRRQDPLPAGRADLESSSSSSSRVLAQRIDVSGNVTPC